MNGAHDMGGMMGFGPVRDELEDPVFHSHWERRAFALTLAAAAAGRWSIDEARQARERLSPPVYLSKTYYEIWIAGLEALLAERGLVSREEIDAGRCLGTVRPVERILETDRVDAMIARGGPTFRADGPASRRANPCSRFVLPAAALTRCTAACSSSLAAAGAAFGARGGMLPSSGLDPQSCSKAAPF